jgi:TetR/AcrR family transcriptional regulator, tetracycline repressor protein
VNDGPALPPRGRGRRAGLDRERILRVAREMPPASLTMQEVAARLGVDRKAVHHHVRNRDALLELLAEEVLQERLSHLSVNPDRGWRAGAMSFALQMRDAFEAADAYVPHFRLTPRMTLDTLGAAEAILEGMVAAGFTETIAARGLLAVSMLATGFVREQRTVGDGSDEVRAFRAVIAATENEMPVLRQLDAQGFSGRIDEQFAFAVTTLLDGLDASRAS